MSTTTAISNDKLWLLSCAEIWGNKKEAAGLEGSQYKYYVVKGRATLNKTLDGLALTWWLRSPLNAGSNYFFCTVDNFANDNNCNASASWGVVPGFAI